jgi:hypothetical protein
MDVGGVIVRIRRILLAISLFDRLRDHSSVSVDACKAGVSPTACLGGLGSRVCAVVPLMLLLTAFNSAALAQSGSAAQPAISKPAHSFAGFINEASQRFAMRRTGSDQSNAWRVLVTCMPGRQKARWA